MSDFDYTKLDEIVLFDGNGDLIELERDGRYINLKKPTEIDKRYYRYDLKERKFQRVNFYKTRPTAYNDVKVKNITGWFTNCRMITKDLHFGRLIVFAKYNSRFDKYSSPVRFIEQLGHPIILAIEQWEALGFKLQPVEDFFGDHLKNVWISGQGRTDIREYVFTLNKKVTGGKTPYIRFYSYIDILPGQLNKEVLKYLKSNKPLLTREILRDLKENYNNGEYYVEQELKKIGQDPEFSGIFHYTTEYRYRGQNPRRWAFGTSQESRRVKNNLIKTIKDYNLDLISLCRWLKKQLNVEKNDVGYLFGSGNHYHDYLECEFELCDGLYSKMLKYPDNFRTEFHRKQEEYTAKIAEVDESKFKQISEENKKYEHIGKKYIVKIPKKTEEIHHEALILKHCVRTYIPRVIDGFTLIAFLRNKNYPEEPLVTLEIKNGALTQAYGKNDSKPTEEELEFLNFYIKKKKLNVGCWTETLTSAS